MSLNVLEFSLENKRSLRGRLCLLFVPMHQQKFEVSCLMIHKLTGIFVLRCSGHLRPKIGDRLCVCIISII